MLNSNSISGAKFNQIIKQKNDIYHLLDKKEMINNVY